MSLIKEINENMLVSNELINILNEFKEMKIENLITELDINSDDSIEWEQPEKKPVIMKTSSEENIHKRSPVVQKGSPILVNVNNKTIPGIVSGDVNGNLIVSYKNNGIVNRISPQPKEKFQFLKVGPSGKEVFKLVGNFRSDPPQPRVHQTMR